MENNNEYYRVSKEAHKRACAKYYEKVKNDEHYKAKRRERYQEKKKALKTQKAQIEENKSI